MWRLRWQRRERGRAGAAVSPRAAGPELRAAPFPATGLRAEGPPCLQVREPRGR